jgi:L-2-hydroxyglutarate oxidase LhgO
MADTPLTIVGAGVVGLAVARRLAADGREVLILEAGTAFGTGISARNSEVIHAGIHYPAGSLKAGLCVRGRRMLYAYCAERGIAHRRCGKLIVATSEPQRAQLERIAAGARANGVGDLQPLSREQARALEPALECTAALLSPSTGIIDSHALMLAIQGEAEAAGTIVALRSPVVGGEASASGILLHVGGAAPTQIACDWLINAAGLSAPELARRIDGVPAASVPRSFRCKGNYYTLSGRSPFARP